MAKRSGKSPTQRTLAALRELGDKCQVVERWNQHAFKRIDLYGFIDIVSLRPRTQTIVGVQCTSADHVADRVTKITSDPGVVQLAEQWLRCGGRIEVWGWRKLEGSRSWEPSVTAVTLDEVTGTFDAKVVVRSKEGLRLLALPRDET